jgi:WXG100 family type VII secretion target
MGDIVQVDHEALEAVAGKFNQQSEAVQQMMQTVQAAMNRLENDWIGRGSEAFFAEMQKEILPAVNRLVQALAMAGTVTKEINQIMQQADEEASSPFRSNEGAGGAGGMTGRGAGASSGGAPGGAAPGGLGASILNNPGGLGSSFFGGNVFGEGATGGMSAAGFGAGGLGSGANDYGIPRDWLAGVKNSLQGDMQSNPNDYGIPRDWLSGVKEGLGQPATETDAPAADSGASSSGGSSGGGSSGGGGSEESGGGSGGGSGSGGGGGPQEQTPMSERAQPRSSAPTDIRSPYSGGGSFARSNFGSGIGGGGAGEATAEPTAARSKYQPLGVVMGGSAAPSGGTGTAGSSGGGGGGAPAAASSGGGSLLAVGLGVASPFVALLGKAMKKEGDND